MNQERIKKVGLGLAVAVLLFATQKVSWSGVPTSQAEKLVLTNTELPDATVGSIYHCLLLATGGKKPYDYVATGLPKGLSLGITQFQDTISGTPTTPGTFSVTVSASDSAEPNPASVSKVLQLKVLPKK